MRALQRNTFIQEIKKLGPKKFVEYLATIGILLKEGGVYKFNFYRNERCIAQSDSAKESILELYDERHISSKDLRGFKSHIGK